jgi:CubicO group peptidase (beta-lactamase class C family)
MIYRVNEKVSSLINQQVKDGRQIGVQVCSYRYGKKIVDTWAGRMGPDDNRPVQADSLFFSWSTTKGVAATALHILADKGLIEYDVPVIQYWPRFRKHGKDKITVAEAMSHQAGVYVYPTHFTIEDLADWEKGIKYIEEAKPAFKPGTKTGYHALTFSWIVGGIIQGATGRHIKDVIKEEIAEPLGIEDEMFCGIPDGLMDRLTTLEVYPEGFSFPADSEFHKASPPVLLEIVNDMRIRKACLPAYNGHFTARALAKMYGALANGGEIEGTRLVSKGRIRDMQRLMTDDIDVVLGSPEKKGIGFYLGGLGGERPFGPRLTSFGHLGAGGSVGFADPETGLSVAITVNKMGSSDRRLEICDLIRTELGV